MSHHRNTVAVAAIAGLAALSCSKDQQPPPGPTYEAHCSITVESVGQPEPIRVEGQGATQDEGERAAWAAFCAQFELGERCRDALPEGFRSQGVMCLGLTNSQGTGLSITGPAYTCTLNLEDRRAITRAEGSVERTGSMQELEDYSDVLCAEAIAQACAELGAQGDCTAGDAAEYRVTSRSAGRRLAGTRPR